MKKIIILPYFGQFNEYFNLWLKSCEYNKNIDWLIITDCMYRDKLPQNIKLINMKFNELVDFIQRKFIFKINLKNPYKLCDYRPCYGYIFNEYIKGYDFWGYCDCDLIFGDIEKFLNEDMFKTYDKILRRGHLSFIRNTEDINTNFFKYDTYKMILKSPVSYAYDESVYGYHNGFAGELLESGYKFLEDSEYIADVEFRKKPFTIINSDDRKYIFSFENGKTYKIYLFNEKIIKEEVMYIHFQKRKMKNLLQISLDKFLMCPNEFFKYDESLIPLKINQSEVLDEEKYFNYNKEKVEAIKRDIIRFLYEPKKISSLMYRVKSKL